VVGVVQDKGNRRVRAFRACVMVDRTTGGGTTGRVGPLPRCRAPWAVWPGRDRVGRRSPSRRAALLIDCVLPQHWAWSLLSDVLGRTCPTQEQLETASRQPHR